MKKALEETQTLRAGCSKAEPKKISPRRRPPSRWRRMANIHSAGDGHYLHPQTQFGEDRCTQFRVIVVTDPQTNTTPARQLQTGPITIHCAAKLSAQCKRWMACRRNACGLPLATWWSRVRLPVEEWLCSDSG